MKIFLWVTFIYFAFILILFAVSNIAVRIRPKKNFSMDADGGIISTNGNLSIMAWFDMIKYDFDRNIPYLLSNYGGIVVNGFYTIIRTMIKTVWYFIQMVGIAFVLIYRAIVVPANARAAIKSYTVKTAKKKRK